MSRIPCKHCSKRFRTERGLRWHLLHIHEYRDVEQLLMEPAPSTLAKVAVMRELRLAAFAKGSGADVQTLQNLISKHFPEYGSRPPPQGGTQHVSTGNIDEPLRSNTKLYLPPIPPGTNLDFRSISSKSQRAFDSIGKPGAE
jgi:hypothetical protein